MVLLVQPSCSESYKEGGRKTPSQVGTIPGTMTWGTSSLPLERQSLPILMRSSIYLEEERGTNKSGLRALPCSAQQGL